jgi:hypothetical protein
MYFIHCHTLPSHVWGCTLYTAVTCMRMYFIHCHHMYEDVLYTLPSHVWGCTLYTAIHCRHMYEGVLYTLPSHVWGCTLYTAITCMRMYFIHCHHMCEDVFYTLPYTAVTCMRMYFIHCHTLPSHVWGCTLYTAVTCMRMYFIHCHHMYEDVLYTLHMHPTRNWPTLLCTIPGEQLSLLVEVGGGSLWLVACGSYLFGSWRQLCGYKAYLACLGSCGTIFSPEAKLVSEFHSSKSLAPPFAIQ